MERIPTFTLNDGNTLPAIGFGTYKAKNALPAMLEAFKTGYRLFDTAWIYENEDDVGRAWQESGLKRQDVFLATKVWPNYFSADLAKKSIDRSLASLGTDYLDVVYLHWWGSKYREAWKVLEQYKEEGVIRSIAVSNFTRDQIEGLSVKANIKPALDQVEIHPLWPETDLLSYLKDQDILPVAYCPLARAKADLFENELVADLCRKYGKTPAQIILNWQVARSTLVIPKSVHADRIRENFDIFDFTLEGAEVEALEGLGRADGKIGHGMDDPEWLDMIEGREL